MTFWLIVIVAAIAFVAFWIVLGEWVINPPVDRIWPSPDARQVRTER